MAFSKIFNNKSAKYIVGVLATLFCIGGAFYWFQWRPAKIRSYCHHQANEKAKLTIKESSLIDVYYPSEEQENKISTEKYKFLYDNCLHSKGLK